MGYPDTNFSTLVNGTEGPVLPVIQHVLHIRPIPLSFERSRSPLLTADPEFEVRALFVGGIDDLGSGGNMSSQS